MKNIGGGTQATARDDSAAHFSDRVTTLCKVCGSPVPRCAQGAVKPTAHSTNGPLWPKDGGKVVATAKSFGCPIGPREQRRSVSFHDRAKIAVFYPGSSMIHGQIVADSSQPWLFETRMSVKNFSDRKR